MKLIYQTSFALVLGVLAAVLGLWATLPLSRVPPDSKPVTSLTLEPDTISETRTPVPQTLTDAPEAVRPPAPAKATGANRRTVVLSEPSIHGPSPVAEVRQPRPRIEVPTPPRLKPAMRPSYRHAPEQLHIVEVATVPTRVEALRLTGSLRQAGFKPYIVWTGSGFATRLGAFRERSRAHSLSRAATTRGFHTRVLEVN